MRVARELGRPLVATGDVHYLRREDYDNHKALLCVQTKSTLSEPKLSFDTNEFYLKDSAEMATEFGEWPESIATTLEIAERCEVEIELGKMLIPRFPAPEGEAQEAYLRRLAQQGLRERYGDPPPAAALERLEMELGVIEKMGFSAYFLIVWDFVKFAKDNGIAVGPGRGSAAGSIVSYALRITDVDPLEYDLLFERFLNAERISMPDIDIDFSVKGRERVIQYVAEKYGRESVAQIITFGRMFPRAATRDAARVLGMDYGAGDRVAKLIPEPVMGRSKSFDEYLGEEDELRRLYDTDPEVHRIIDTAKGLEGIVRNSSIHAAAVVIADRPLTDIVPLQLAEDRTGGGENGERSYRTVTQYSMKPIEEIGLLKMDFLGLRNLDVIEAALDIIEGSSGARPDMTALPLDDLKTYEMLARGDSVGVFQFESDGMRDALRKVKPDEFNDLVALVALYRPGAMRYIDTYARNKRVPEGIHFADERLRPITESSRGVILYQEQSMQIAKLIAGFSGPEADDLRKAIGKKQRDRMAALKDRFFEGARATRHGRGSDRRALGRERGGGRLLLQPLARRVLRADLVPDGVAEGQLPGRVHGRPDLVRDVDEGQGAVLRRQVRGHGDRGAAARREPVGPRLQGGGGQHPLRARRGEGARLPGRRGDHPGAQGGGAVQLGLGLLPARGLPGREQEGERLAREVRGVRLTARHAHRDDGRAAARAGRRPAGAGGRAQRAVVVLRPRRRRHRGRRGAPRPADRAAPGRPQAAERVGEGDARPVPVEPPHQGGAAGAAGAGGLLAHGAGGEEGRRVGHRRRNDRRVQADSPTAPSRSTR